MHRIVDNGMPDQQHLRRRRRCTTAFKSANPKRCGFGGSTGGFTLDGFRLVLMPASRCGRLLTMTFTTAAFGRSSPWLFDASPYRAAPKGRPSSFVQHDELDQIGRQPPFRPS
jgi:hypothetical protein